MLWFLSLFLFTSFEPSISPLGYPFFFVLIMSPQFLFSVVFAIFVYVVDVSGLFFLGFEEIF